MLGTALDLMIIVFGQSQSEIPLMATRSTNSENGESHHLALYNNGKGNKS